MALKDSADNSVAMAHRHDQINRNLFKKISSGEINPNKLVKAEIRNEFMGITMNRHQAILLNDETVLP